MPTKSETEYDKYMKTHLTQAEKDYLEIMGEDIKKLQQNFVVLIYYCREGKIFTTQIVWIIFKMKHKNYRNK